KPVDPPRRQRHLGARGGEKLGQVTADPARCPCHQRHLAREVEARQFDHAATSLARSRSSNFWILPVEVSGSGPKTTARATLSCARLARHHAMMSSAEMVPASGFSVTKAQGLSPQIGSGLATTAASITSG